MFTFCAAYNVAACGWSGSNSVAACLACVAAVEVDRHSILHVEDTQRRIKHSANCAMAWGPRRQGPGLEYWMHFSIGAALA